jgi:hypothetical protein
MRSGPGRLLADALDLLRVERTRWLTAQTETTQAIGRNLKQQGHW